MTTDQVACWLLVSRLDQCQMTAGTAWPLELFRRGSGRAPGDIPGPREGLAPRLRGTGHEKDAEEGTAGPARQGRAPPSDTNCAVEAPVDCPAPLIERARRAVPTSE